MRRRASLVQAVLLLAAAGACVAEPLQRLTAGTGGIVTGPCNVDADCGSGETCAPTVTTGQLLCTPGNSVGGATAAGGASGAGGGGVHLNLGGATPGDGGDAGDASTDAVSDGAPGDAAAD